MVSVIPGIFEETERGLESRIFADSTVISVIGRIALI